MSLLSYVSILLAFALSIFFLRNLKYRKMRPIKQENSIRILPRNLKDDHIERFIYESRNFVTAVNGGTVRIGCINSECLQIFFPLGAINGDNKMSISQERDRYVFTFAPSGLTFSTPIRVTLSYRSADLTAVNEDNIRVYWLNEEKYMWELIGGKIDKNTKTVIVDLHHFSRYALAAE